MKKVRLLQLICSFCIILSFFSCVYAEEKYGNITVINDDKINNSNYNDTSTSLSRTATCTSNGIFAGDSVDSEIKFVPEVSSVFTFKVEASDGTGRELCYVLKDSQGNDVRLAAYYNANDGCYYYFTEKSGTSTSADVWLKAGEEYTLRLSKLNASLKDNEPYVNSRGITEADFKVTISINDDANRNYGKVYQSDTSIRKISDTNAFGYQGGNAVDPDYADLEVVDPAHAMPEGNNNVQQNQEPVKALEYEPNVFEEVISDLLLMVGDHITNLMTKVVGEEVTITALVYNQVDEVNPNFFDKTISGKGVAAPIKEAVSKWYNIFTKIAFTIYLLVLLFIGVNVLLRTTSDGLSKAKELIVDWIKGMVYLIFIPYLIKYAFLLNESLVELLRQEAKQPNYKVGGSFVDNDSWSTEEIEFRSPEYVSKYTGGIAYGSYDASKGFITKLPSYEQNLDLMRIMRAYAGVTKKFAYVIIWYILIGQLIAFIVQYYKRFFTIAFLIAAFPIVCIFNGITIMQGKKGKEIGSWMKELFTNIFIQFVHAIIYTIITSICLSIIKDNIAGTTSGFLNWLIIILAINFVSEGEKILRKILGAMGNTVSGTGKSGQGVKGAINRARGNFNKLMGKG